MNRQALVETKRDILLTKLRIEDNKESVKSLKDAISFEQKYLEAKTKDIERNRKLLDMNFRGLGKQKDQIEKEVKQKESLNIIRISELNKLKNEIIKKDQQLQEFEKQKKTLLSYQLFINDILTYSGEQPNQNIEDGDDKIFLTELEKSEGGFPPEKFINLLNKIEEDNLMLIKILQNQKHEIQKLKVKIEK